ncbi:hypothetical protein [Kitasatospora sp. NPDC059327]|uniref:hypothetical protein n=1 Tax=Kitasatospora sp. NPDC059327 TaxID=3346803 RepID=UPI0036C39855
MSASDSVGAGGGAGFVPGRGAPARTPDQRPDVAPDGRGPLLAAGAPRRADHQAPAVLHGPGGPLTGPRTSAGV